MKNNRRSLIKKISKSLGGRELYWYGIRGDDSRSLSDLPEFSGSITITNQCTWQPLDAIISYESLTGIRVDLDRWDIDDHWSDQPTVEYRQGLLRKMHKPHAIIPYRPSGFLSALMFARHDKTLNLGMIHVQQRAFEYKPWVESSLKSLGVPTPNWQYVADEEQIDAKRLLSKGPIIVRPNKGSGGVGISKVTTETELAEMWPSGVELFASISQYMEDNLPLNIGAVVWDDGITLHYPSVQLIGLPSCVNLRFGYCGNDFSLIKTLDEDVIDQLEDTTIVIGRWLQERGYRGAFGVDYMLVSGRLVLSEVNPRFQGSTRISSMIAARNDLPCLLIDHLAAMLHIDAPERPRLYDLVKECDDASQIIVHNTTDRLLHVDQGQLQSLQDSKWSFGIEIAPDESIGCNPGSTLFSLVQGKGVTEDGYSLVDDNLAKLIARTVDALRGDRVVSI